MAPSKSRPSRSHGQQSDSTRRHASSEGASSSLIAESRDSQTYEPVARAWESTETAVRETIYQLEGRSHDHSQHRSLSTQPVSAPTTHNSHQNYPPEWYLGNVGPPGMSNNPPLVQGRPPAPPLESWMREEQRVGPYNNVGSVGVPSDYEESYEGDRTHQINHHNERYGREDANEGYENESDGTFYAGMDK